MTLVTVRGLRSGATVLGPQRRRVDAGEHRMELLELTQLDPECGDHGRRDAERLFPEPTTGLGEFDVCLLYTSPSPRDLSTSRMPSSA